MNAAPAQTLVSFLTRNMSLQAWRRVGMLERELALFRGLAARGWEVHLVSYGGRGDLALAPPELRVHVNPLRLPTAAYLRWLGFRLRGLRGRAVVRCNQVRGGELAAGFARRLGLPFVARCGYLPSLFSEWSAGVDSAEAKRDLALEREVFGSASRVVVSTAELAERVAATCPRTEGRIAVVPNFVETDRFAPRRPATGEGIVFVGRLEDQKNVSLLLQALSDTPWRLTVIGGGPLREPLEQEAAALRVNARFLGNVSNADLPRHLGEAAAFCLPSRYEGHPKALLEAMACGLAVVATDAPGTRGVVRDGENGLLCKPEPDALRAALRSVMEDADRRRALGEAARSYVLAECSLDRALEGELAVLAAAGAA